jgi:hypothetical protein
MPAISVLLPVRDGAPWLASSLDSLWRQSERDFEVIAVDDGSIDDSAERLERAARHEPRLRVVRTAARGLPSALNTALALARAPLIARQDADDFSHRDRFAIQRAMLEANAGDVVGSRVRLFPAAATGPGMRRWAAWHNGLLTHDAMAAERFIDSPLAHGTALMRRAAIEAVGAWRENGLPEDLDLWLRWSGAGLRFAKSGRVLYGWRQHAASATRRDPRYRPEAFLALKADALARSPIAARGRALLVGVGASLARWRDALSGRLALELRVAPAPSRGALAGAGAPVLLVFGMAAVRARWRRWIATEHPGWVEGDEFIFVA